MSDESILDVIKRMERERAERDRKFRCQSRKPPQGFYQCILDRGHGGLHQVTGAMTWTLPEASDE